MKNIVITILFSLLFIASTFAQTNDTVAVPNSDTSAEAQPFLVPDYDYLDKVTNDKTSKFYYPSLLKRFAKADTTMSIYELHCLYYGSVIQKGYNPYHQLDEEDKALSLLNNENVSMRDAKKALKLLNSAVEKEPAQLRLYMYRHYANSVIYGKESTQAKDDVFRYYALIEAIWASGSGESYESAFHVAVPSHAYDFMHYFGFSAESQELSPHNGQSFDIYTLEENKYDIEHLYFNVSPCLSFLNRKFSSADLNDDTTPTTSVDINIGTRMVLKVEKDSTSKGYLLTVVEKDEFKDTLDISNFSSIFPDKNDDNTIIVYCAHGEGGKVFLSLKSFCDEAFEYDTFMRLVGGHNFVSTSNSGIFPHAAMNEIWSDNVATIRISNLRSMK